MYVIGKLFIGIHFHRLLYVNIYVNFLHLNKIFIAKSGIGNSLLNVHWTILVAIYWEYLQELEKVQIRNYYRQSTEAEELKTLHTQRKLSQEVFVISSVSDRLFEGSSSSENPDVAKQLFHSHDDDRKSEREIKTVTTKI